MPTLGISSVSDARGAQPTHSGVSVEKTRDGFGASVASHGLVVPKRFGISLDKWMHISCVFEKVLMLVLFVLVCGAVGPAFNFIIDVVIQHRSSASNMDSLLAAFVGSTIAFVTTVTGALIKVIPARVHGVVFSWSVLVAVRKVCVEKGFKGRLQGGAAFAATVLLGVDLFVAAAAVSAAGPLSSVVCVIEVVSALFGAALTVPILHEVYGTTLGVAGVCFGAVIVAFVGLLSPVFVQFLLAFSNPMVTVYSHVSTQEVIGTVEVGGVRFLPSDIKTISLRISIPVNSEFVQCVGWQDMILLSSCAPGEPGGPKVRMAALVGDRVLAAALSVHAATHGWSVARESSASQVLLSNETFSKVFDIYAADLVPTMAGRSAKRKGTFIEAFIGAAYLSGSLTDSDLLAFMRCCVEGVLSKKIFD